MFSTLRMLLCVAAVIGLTACASADGFFSGPRVIHAHGSFNPTKVQTEFVHDGQTAYAEWRSSVIAYGGTTYAYRGASVHGFDNATIYYQEGAYVETHGNARAFLCEKNAAGGLDLNNCRQTH